jgi:hypothetical protein
MGPRLTPDGHDTWGGRQPPTTVGHQPSCQVGGCGSGMPVTAATSRHVSPNPEQPQVEVFDQPGQHRRFVGFQQERLGIAVLGGGERVQVKVRVLCEAVLRGAQGATPAAAAATPPRGPVDNPWITLRAASSRRPFSAPAGRPGVHQRTGYADGGCLSGPTGAPSGSAGVLSGPGRGMVSGRRRWPLTTRPCSARPAVSGPGQVGMHQWALHLPRNRCGSSFVEGAPP